MQRVLLFVTVATFIISGCKKDREAHAISPESSQTQSTGVTVKKGVRTGQLLSEDSFTEYLPENTLLYVSLPDTGNLVAALKTQPLKGIWKNSAIPEHLRDLLGEKAWKILARWVDKAERGEIRGPLEFALVPAGQGEGSPWVKGYLSWRPKTGAEEFTRSMADFFIALRERVPDLAVKEGKQGESTVWTVELQGHKGYHISFSTVSGRVRISNGRSFLGTGKRLKLNLKDAPRFQKVISRVFEEKSALVFAYASFPEALSLIKKSWSSPQPGAALPEKLLKRTGLRGIRGLGIASYRHKGRIIEKAYLDWPEEKRGVLSAFFCDANVKGGLAVVPYSATAVNVLGIDLKKAWQGIKGTVLDAFPPLQSVIAQQIHLFEKQIQAGVPALLECFGKTLVSYHINTAEGRPAKVFLLSLKKPDVLRKAITELEKSTGGTLVAESVKAVPLYKLPAPLKIKFAVCENYAAISKNIEALRNFVRRQGGFGNPFAGRPQVKKLLQDDNLAAASFTDLRYGLASIPVFESNFPGGKAARRMLGEAVQALSRISTEVGEIWSFLYVNEEGLTNVCRSACGVLPLGISIGCAGASVGIPAGIKAKRAARRKAVVEAVNEIVMAQYEFRSRHRRYAQNLWELKRLQLIPPALGRGCYKGHLFKLKSSGPETWKVHVAPVDKRGAFFYCDQTGTLRIDKDGRADSGSIVVKQ